MASIENLHLDIGQLGYIFNHVFLPPNVPQEDDSQDFDEKALLRIIEHALKQFKDHVSKDMSVVIDNVYQTVHRLHTLLDQGGVTSGERLQEALTSIKGTNHCWR